MRIFFDKLKGGLGFGLGILITLFIGSVIASLNSVEPGDTLTANKWNELVGNVNSLNSEIQTLKNENASLNAVIPEGIVSAFNLSSCPSGWLPANGENGTPDLRGSFIRGLGGDENGRDEARILGSYQDDAMRPIAGNYSSYNTAGSAGTPADGPWEAGAYMGYYGSPSHSGNYWVHQPRFNSGRMGENYNGSDTHPKNVALIYCIKN